MLTWLKDNGPVIGALAGALLAFAAVLQLVVVGPINNRFDDQDKYMNARFDAVDQRFDAVSQRFDDMDRNINQRFDAVNQRFDAVNQRFDDMDRSINQRFDDMDRSINQRFDAANQRFDVLTTEVAELRSLIVGIIERVSRNEGQINVLREQLQAIDTPTP